jgi:5-methylcytosine-specific restriction endonuclease McrA
MSKAYISSALRKAVAQASLWRCGYRLTSEQIIGAELTIDHIVPESLGGATTLDNLCLACWGCNLHKQDRVVAIDPDTGQFARLFHPVQQKWSEHVVWCERGLLIIGSTPTGRATVRALRLNRPRLVHSRRLWIAAGWHPPIDSMND